jgi:hypothetical protein
MASLERLPVSGWSMCGSVVVGYGALYISSKVQTSAAAFLTNTWYKEMLSFGKWFFGRKKPYHCACRVNHVFQGPLSVSMTMRSEWDHEILIWSWISMLNPALVNWRCKKQLYRKILHNIA